VGGSNLTVNIVCSERGKQPGKKRSTSRYFAIAQSAETGGASSRKTAIFGRVNARIAPIGRTRNGGTH
jgi:hypothetical protein